jgi:hypothetical protein
VVTLTTVTVAASAAPGGATGAGDDRPRRLVIRVKRDMMAKTEKSVGGNKSHYTESLDGFLSKKYDAYGSATG